MVVGMRVRSLGLAERYSSRGQRVKRHCMRHCAHTK